jgi:UDP-N-acetyl-D-glucosamine/UDP-N-acetyl-D-galactosamine dehydrogenase
MTEKRKIAVVGLGYVGLPVAAGFARGDFQVVGLDIDAQRVRELREGQDRTREVEPDELRRPNLVLTDNPQDMAQSDFFIVTVPTPIDDARRPDLGAALSASRTVGQVLKRGDIVVYESTVYPGATEEDFVPVLEASSGLSCGRDFTVGYSPERINPGDKAHRFENIMKVVSGQDARTSRIVAETYGAVISAGVHVAPSIRVAEAAKVIENTQRDLNIALMNELSAIFERLGIDSHDVLAAAGTKWNFLRFSPGLVGGHCIGVDPYYLTHRAEKAGFHPEVILAGRRTNDSVGQRVARSCVRMLAKNGNGRKVAVLGLAFKEDVPDIRNSKIVDIVRELEAFGCEPRVCDPLADPAQARHEYGIALHELEALEGSDAVVLAVPHKEFMDEGWSLVRRLLGNGAGAVLDVKSRLDRSAKPPGVDLWRL